MNTAKLLTLFFVLIALRPVLAADAPVARLDESRRDFLKLLCVECHNAEKQKGKTRLDNIAFEINTVERADLWQKVLNQINSGEMPPEEAKQPERAAKTDFLDALSQTLAAARRNLSDARGKITMRRLNRREYKNTIRDLLGVELRVNELPADGGAGSFDTVGSSLYMSSSQFEQYVALGRQALDEHFARNKTTTKPRYMHIETEDAVNPRVLKGLKERIDQHERYEKWVAAVTEAAQKPENADTATKIRAEKKDPLHLQNEWARIPGAPAPSQFGFTDAVHAEQMGHRDWLHYVPHHRAYTEQPLTKTGSFLTFDDVYVNTRQTFRLPGDWPAGDYVIRARIAVMDGMPKERRFVEFGPLHDSGVGAVSGTYEVKGTVAQPQVLEIPLKFSPDKERGYFFRERGSGEVDALANKLFGEAKARNGIGPEFAIWIDWIEVASASSQRTYKERREVEEHANKVVGGTYNGYFKGGYTVAKAYLDSDRSKPPSAFGKGIADEQEAKFRVHAFEENGPTFERYLNDPLTKTGAYLTIHNVHTEEVITLPPDQPSGWMKIKHETESVPPGDYLLRFKIGAVKDTPKERHFVELGHRVDAEQFALINTFQITGTTSAPQLIEVPVKITEGGPRTFVLREKRDVKLDQELYTAAVKATKVGPPPALWMDWVEWEGPLDKGEKQSAVPPVIFANKDGLGEREYARETIRRFAVRAFRDREPGGAYLDKLTALFETRRKSGDTFEDAIREPLSAVLASPGFLYLTEPGVETRSRVLTDTELAVRLSYFLWSAPPDEPLLALARKNELHSPQVLSGQVERMLADAKSAEFVSGFVHQWLGMERLDFFQFDTKQYRDFDESIRAAARREVYETFAILLRDNGSLSNMLKSDWVCVNGLLATYYGIEGVEGDAYRKVPLPANSPRGGLLGMAAIMAMGSNGERSSPVERGAWVLRKLLHDPPPPAPPNVPQLTRLENKLLTSRERILAHQEQPQCMQCHRKIDPIGFGLENFNAAGKWREEETYEKKGVGKKSWRIDPSGALHNGPAFKNFGELRDVIAARPEKFARGFTEALIEYALGRPYGFLDAPLADKIVEKAAAKKYQTQDFILQLVLSDTFREK